MRIIVDAMGGDKAPLEIVKGVYDASLEYSASFILVGDKEKIYVYRYKFDGSRETITNKAINYGLYLAYNHLKKI